MTPIEWTIALLMVISLSGAVSQKAEFCFICAEFGSEVEIVDQDSEPVKAP